MPITERIKEVEKLTEVTSVESGEAPETYIVWIYGGSDPDILNAVEEVSGWAVVSFNGAKGNDIGLVCAERDGNTPDL